MRIKQLCKILTVLFTIVLSTISCSSSGEDEDPTLTVSVTEISFEPDGGTSDVSLTTNGTWTVSNPASWLQINNTSGGSGTATITVTSGMNGSQLTRTATITVTSSNGQARRITVTQTGNLYPSYNLSPKASDATGMSSTAVQLAAKMQVGMGTNIGNTMESPNEGEWVNSKITESYIQFLKAQGFSAVRLPTGWVWSHLSDPDKMTIDPAWLARVKEVVGWCVANEMYVMLNAHGDNGWLENSVNAASQEVINAKLKAIWEQIATEMRDFNEYLLFAGTNEPKADTPEQMAILNGYHETFIKAVRSTGGKNSYRVLVVQGAHTDPNKTSDLMTTLPKDEIPNKLMVEVHDYTPPTFTLLNNGDATWGKAVYYWGTGNLSTIEPDRNATGEQESLIDTEMQRMKENFVDKGIPVILGEYASWRRTAATNANYLPLDLDKHNQSVEYWAKYVTKQAKANGILPFWWEIGFLFDRKNNEVKDQAMFDAIKAGYNE